MGQREPVYDVSGAIERMGGDRAFLAECVDLFEAELPPLLASLRESIRRGSPDEVYVAAHAIKGMSSNFCTKGPAQTADRLVRLSRDGELAQARGLVEQLERELQFLLAVLHAIGPAH